MKLNNTRQRLSKCCLYTKAGSIKNISSELFLKVIGHGEGFSAMHSHTDCRVYPRSFKIIYYDQICFNKLSDYITGYSRSLRNISNRTVPLSEIAMRNKYEI